MIPSTFLTLQNGEKIKFIPPGNETYGEPCKLPQNMASFLRT